MSNIEWTDTTWSPVVGCTPVSPGCLNCYAATMARRLEAMGRTEYAPREVECYACGGEGTYPDVGRCPWCSKGQETVRIAEVRGGRAVFTGDVRTVPDRLTDPLHWRKPRMVFVNSMSDLFHEDVPFEFIDRVFAVMALCPQHTFQVLTKRPERMAEYCNRRYMPGAICDAAIAMRRSIVKTEIKEHDDGAYSKLTGPAWPLPNVWLGASVEDQARADERIPNLLRCPAAVRFLSCEPLLGELDIGRWLCDNVYLNWVIVGGESGPNARPCDVAWIRSIVRQCREAGVTCFVKQLGAWPECDESGSVQVLRCRACGTVQGNMECDVLGGDEAVYRVTRKGKKRKVVMVREEELFCWKCGASSQRDGPQRLHDRKGGDPSEWPEDLRVREWPKGSDESRVTSDEKGGA